VGCTTVSREEVLGERKLVIRDDDNEVICVESPCSFVVGYQHGPPERWYRTITQHCVTT